MEYTYDAFDRLIGREVDTDGDTNIDETQRFIYDGEHIALAFDENDGVTNRYLHGPAIDMVLADEQVGGDLLWTLADNQGTIRDLVSYDAGTDTTTAENHRTFNSFGKLTSETSAAIDHLFAYTGRILDEVTGDQNHRARWYDTDTGKWLSEDPIKDGTNWGTYLNNGPANSTDPTGLSGESVSIREGTTYDTSNSAYSGGIIVGGYMGEGDKVKTAIGTIKVLSGNLEDSGDKDFALASCILKKLGFALPATENGIYWAQMPGIDFGYTATWVGWLQDDLNFTFINEEFKGIGSDPTKPKFEQFLVTIWHEVKGHNIDEATHDNKEESDNFDAKYEEPIRQAIAGAKASGKWNDLIEKCQREVGPKGSGMDRYNPKRTGNDRYDPPITIFGPYDDRPPGTA